jgi:hypothetical protein
VARSVYLHVGTPKTGTTFLQTVMWRNRRALRRKGLLMPGDQRPDHLYASLVIRGATGLERRHPDAPTSWERICGQVQGWKRTAVISHEFFGAATAEQATAAIAALAPAEVHVVVTARDLVKLFPSMWQEHIKFRGTEPLAQFADAEDSDPLRVWGWRTMDASDVLDRWGRNLPPDRIHVVTVPPKGSPPEVLWQRFAGLLGVDPSACDATVGRVNDSLGLAEVELLRRVNPHLGDGLPAPRDVGRWLRGYLGRSVLAARGGQRFGPDLAQREQLVERGTRIASQIRDRGYDVIGDLDDLLPTPDETLPDPSSVTDAQMLDVATETISRMLIDLRTATRERDEARGKLPKPWTD